MIDKKLISLLGDNRKLIFYISLLNIVGMLANIATTAAICFLLYLIMISSNIAINYLSTLIVVIIAIVTKIGISKAQVAFKNKLGAVIKNDLRSRIFYKISTLGGYCQENETNSGLTQIAIEGTEQLELYYTSYLPQLFYAMISPILLFAICVAIDYRTAFVLVLCVPIIPIAIVCVSKYAKKIFNKYWNKYISMGDVFLDNLQGMQELKIFNADARAQINMDKQSEEFRKITMKVLVMQLMSITIMDIVAFGGAGIGIVMALMSGVDKGLAPMLAIFLILISAEFFLPMRALGSAFHIAMNGASAGNRIIKFLETKEPVWGNKLCNGGDISLTNVTFAYTAESTVLNNINILFPKKTFTAIVGESGCGKSTIVSLIIGKIRPEMGEVRIGTEKLNDYDRKSYYSKIALVSHNTFIFGMSIRDNFYLAKKDATEEDISCALHKVNLLEFVEKSGGIDCLINENASNISGGERQRLALAINLLSNKDIYIFDEATSNIDVESETIIMNNICALASEKTVILISHRMSNATRADNICVLMDGTIVESGKHEDLVVKDGYYRRLFKAQSKLENDYKKVQNA